MFAIRHNDGPLLAHDGESWVSLKSKDHLYINPHWMQMSAKVMTMKNCRVVPVADLLDELRQRYPDTHQVDGPRAYTEKGVNDVQTKDIDHAP